MKDNIILHLTFEFLIMPHLESCFTRKSRTIGNKNQKVSEIMLITFKTGSINNYWEMKDRMHNKWN